MTSADLPRTRTVPEPPERESSRKTRARPVRPARRSDRAASPGLRHGAKRTGPASFPSTPRRDPATRGPSPSPFEPPQAGDELVTQRLVSRALWLVPLWVDAHQSFRVNVRRIERNCVSFSKDNTKHKAYDFELSCKS